MQKILVLAALPDRLRLDQEIRVIEEAIKLAVKRHSFEVRIRTAVRPQDIRRAIAEEQPQIVHFCGHGLENGSLVLEDNGGNHCPVLPTGLAALFKLHSDYVKCVLLNACYSAKSAEVISQHINYVIGMNQPIGDKAAIVFAQGFYDGLGYDNINNQDVIQRAYDEGCVAIQMVDILQGSIPVLKKKDFLIKYLSTSSEKIVKIAIVAAAVMITAAAMLVWSRFYRKSPIPTSPPLSSTSGKPVGNIQPSPEPSLITPNKRKSSFAEVDVRPLEGKKFKYAGSTVLAVLLCSQKSSGDTGIHHQIKLAHPNLQLEYISPDDGKPPDSGEGIKMLINGQVDFVISSRIPTKQEEAQIKVNNFKFERIPVAQYAIAIVVNSEVGLTRGITLKELDEIFAGKIKNWTDVGGDYQFITPLVHIAEKNAHFSFTKNVVANLTTEVAKNTKYVNSTTDGLQEVARNTRGIYRVPAPLSFGQRSQFIQTIRIVNKNNETALPYKEDSNFKPSNNCKDLNSNNLLNTESITSAPINTKYPEELQEPMYVIFKHYSDNSKNSSERAGRAYAELLLTAQGQKMLEHIGFMRIP